MKRVSAVGSLLAGAILLAADLLGQSIFTFAGGSTDDGRPATAAAMGPVGVVVDGEGTLYLTDGWNSRVRRVDARTRIITAYAGIGGGSFSGDGGPATKAAVKFPSGIAIDPAGNLCFADWGNARIRCVDKSGMISTVAGNGTFGYNGDGLAATASALWFPSSLAFDSVGNMFIADQENHRIRRVDAQTRTMTTVAGTGAPSFAGDGGRATESTLNAPRDVKVDRDGNLFIADRDNHRIRRVDQRTGRIETVAGNANGGRYDGDGRLAIDSALYFPQGVAVDGQGRLYISDAYNERIRTVDPMTGLIATLVDPALTPVPTGISLDHSGSLYFCGGARVYRIDLESRSVTTVAGNGAITFSGDGGPATLGGLSWPHDLTISAAGDVYIADTSHASVRRVEAATRRISTLEIGQQAYYFVPRGIALAPDGDIVVAGGFNVWKGGVDTGTTTILAGSNEGGFAGDDGPATTAKLSDPHGVAYDRSGNLYIADTYNNRVRRVDASTGIITTVVGDGVANYRGDGEAATRASLNFPTDVAIDADGNLLIADSNNLRIRKVVISTGIITTIAGNGAFAVAGDDGPATLASFKYPSRIEIDNGGNIYVADAAIRRIDRLSGIITTVAGDGQSGFRGDGGAATRAALNYPRGLAIDREGNLFIADTQNDRVRVVYRCAGVVPARLRSPSHGSSGVSTAPNLSWNPVPSAFRYDVYLDTANPPTKLAAQDIEQASFSPSNLEPLTTYYWKVTAKGDPFCHPFQTSESEIRAFTTEGSCLVPGAFDSTSPR